MVVNNVRIMWLECSRHANVVRQANQALSTEYVSFRLRIVAIVWQLVPTKSEKNKWIKINMEPIYRYHPPSDLRFTLT